MGDNSPFLILVQSYAEALAWATHRLGRAGLQVIRTFDLQTARHTHVDCPCPHHGTEQCDCQMVVLLVYSRENRPISLLVHSFDGRTWFSLVDTPQQRADPCLETAILQALTSQSTAPSNGDSQVFGDASPLIAGRKG